MPKTNIKAMIKDLKKNELIELISVAQIVSNLVRNFIPEKSHKSIMLR